MDRLKNRKPSEPASALLPAGISPRRAFSAACKGATSADQAAHDPPSAASSAFTASTTSWGIGDGFVGGSFSAAEGAADAGGLAGVDPPALGVASSTRNTKSPG